MGKNRLQSRIARRATHRGNQFRERFCAPLLQSFATRSAVDQRIHQLAQPRPIFHLPGNRPLLRRAFDPGIQNQYV